MQPYLSLQPDITASMRTILVDWLIEVQENFELFHETLYLAVKLVDLYLARKEVKREYLQLVGATCMLISSKFEVRSVCQMEATVVLVRVYRGKKILFICEKDVMVPLKDRVSLVSRLYCPAFLHVVKKVGQ